MRATRRDVKERLNLILENFHPREGVFTIQRQREHRVSLPRGIEKSQKLAFVWNVDIALTLPPRL